MFILSKVGNTHNRPTQEFICDSEADITNLPAEAPFGSAAICIAEKSVWFKNSAGVWSKF